MKKIGILLMSLILVFSMTVPAFATTYSGYHNIISPKYLAIGDSIGTGVKGADMLSEEAFKASAIFDKETRKRDWNINSVDYSYVNKFAKAIRANRNSWNETFVSLRAKDYCYLLGLADDKAFDIPFAFGLDDLLLINDGDFSSLDINKIMGNLSEIKDGWDTIREDFFGWLMYNLFWKDMNNDSTVNELKTAIRKADVITVELGANEISAGAIGDVMCKIMPEILAAVKSTKNIKEADAFISLYNNIMKYVENPYENSRNKLESICSDLVRLKKFGASLKDVGSSYSKLLLEITQSAMRAKYDYEVYTDRLMRYIRRQNPGAIVIATTVPNPMKGLDLGRMLADLGAGNLNLPAIDMADIMKPIVKQMNSFLYRNATKNGYLVADISEVNLNPADPMCVFHPDENGHDVIAAAIEKVYGDKVKEIIQKRIENFEKLVSGIRKMNYKYWQVVE